MENMQNAVKMTQFTSDQLGAMGIGGDGGDDGSAGVLEDLEGQELDFVYVCGASILATAPYIVYQRKQLRDMDSIRRVQNRIRKEVNRLQEENSNENVDDLMDTVSRVAAVEQELSAIASRSTRRYGGIFRSRCCSSSWTKS